MDGTKETGMDKLTTGMAEHICDNLCKYPMECQDKESLEEICCDCRMGQFICDILNEYNKNNLARDMAIKALEEIQQYRCIGTVEEFKALKEKAEPKKPTYEGDGYAPDGSFVWDEWLCPNCGTRYEVDYDKYDYCPNCGQAIDWT